MAGEWCGHQTIWQSEIDPFCVALLAERFPDAKQLGDISNIDWSQVERPDILTGGFPCQDISYAGKGAGLAGARSGLWYEYARAIRDLGPRYVIVENVRALFTRGFDAVLGTLADLGYDAEWSMYGAADVGAPHRRHRVWILAYPTVADADRGGFQILGQPQHADQQGECGDESHGRGAGRWGDGAIPDAIGERSQGIEQAGPASWAAHGPGDGRYPAEWTTEPNVGRVAHGVPARVDRLRGLGNAIVPACAVPIYRRIAELEGE